MVTIRQQICFAFTLVLITVGMSAGIIVGALYATQPALARQADPTPGPDAPLPHYALLNQPGPLWLPGVDFSHEDLYGVNLSDANLRQANFDNAILASADLSGAMLTLATLRNTDLTRANLRDATLSLADLRQANLHGANLANAKMHGALLAGSTLNRADLSITDLRESDLRRADLQFANLSYAQLAGANLMGADLTNADLSFADLSSVNLAEVYLDEAKLENVTYDSVTVWPSNFDVATMTVSGDMQSDGQSNGPSDKTDDDLSITMTLMPQLLSWYSEVVRAQDGALVESAQQVEMLDAIASGDRMVVFKSAALAEELVPLIADKMDTIGYNLEHGPMTPLHEQADPVESVKRLRTLADDYGLDLALGPDHRFALSHGALMAPFVDSYAMQVQRVQSDPQTVREFVIPMAEAVRAVNPAIETTLQVRTEGDAEAIAALIDSVRESIDGVVILSSRETTETAIELVEMLQNDRGSAVDDPISAVAVDLEESSPEELAHEPSPEEANSARPSIAMILFQLLVLVLAAIFAYALWRDMSSRSRTT